mgnify:CR=1 FL=1
MKSLAYCSFLILLLSAGCQTETRETPPNILLFFTDDNGFEYWGFSGGPDLSPHIDAIAEEGLTATQAYISASVCTPSRYSLHTGRFAGRCRHPEFLEEYPDTSVYNITWNTFLDPSRETTLGELLREGGYYTGFVGKWHMGWDHDAFAFDAGADPSDPETDKKLKAFHEEAKKMVRSAGFDYAGSVTPINIDNHPVEAVRYHNLEWFASGARDFLDEAEKSGKPWFLVVNITTHHGPCHIPSIKQPVSLTPAGHVENLEGVMPERTTIFDRIEKKEYPVDFKTAGTVWTDDCVGSVLEYLENKEADDETMVIFTTDHNRYDGKATCYQGGVHIPFVARYPEVIEPGSVMETRFQLTDLLPTFLEAGRIEPEEMPDIDGVSVWDQLTGQSDEPVHDALYFEFGYSRGVLVDNWKYIAVRWPDSLTQQMKNGETSKAFALRGQHTTEPCFARFPHYFDADQLYNIRKDPEEQENLAYDPVYADTLKRMKTTLYRILDSFDHPFPGEADPFYQTARYDSLVANARDIDMNRFYWYRQGCY